MLICQEMFDYSQNSCQCKCLDYQLGVDLCSKNIWEYDYDQGSFYEGAGSYWTNWDGKTIYWGQEYDINNNLGYAFP